MNKFPKRVQELLSAREKLRLEKRYGEADAVRAKLITLGYQVTDTQDGMQEIVLAKEYVSSTASFLVLFGSGETAPSAVRIHRYVFEHFKKKKVSVVILSTPAGFQPNVKKVCEEIAQFFKKHLANYHPQVKIIYANTQNEVNNETLISPLEKADYIFAGPGSPTYAARHLQNSLLVKKLEERIRSGGSLALASAAAMAFSRHVLPVYEISKAGFPLYWEQGLNFYAKVFREMTVIPHYNNTEGGTKLDTSCAFMGRKRFELLRQKLPKSATVLGIDEHTAAVIDLCTHKMRPMGKGKLHGL